jgi:hypothetical protein
VVLQTSPDECERLAYQQLCVCQEAVPYGHKAIQTNTLV